MKWSFLLFSSFLCLQAIAQYPATGNKMRLGWQTTGDGLVYRGAIGDTATLDPSGINNAWMLLDTANGNLYTYRAKAWRLVSGGGGSVSDTLAGEVKGPLDSTYIDTVANIIFTTTTDTTAGVGELKYNDTQGSLIQGLKGGNVTNVIGQQIHQRVTNATGAPLTKGTAVFLHGSQGNRITVRKALATVDSTSANTFGIVAESIANNQSGYVITEGLITNMNTNALTEGAAVYLSPTVAGELTTTKPQAPQHTVYIGVCVKQNAGSGELFVKIRNGQELDELHDVRITSPASNASLYYNTSESVWRDTGAAVLVADTSAMLSSYISNADTATMLSSYISNADTATMLSSYISNADTSVFARDWELPLKLNVSDTSVFARDFQISGTTNRLAMFTGANTVGNSIVTQNGRSMYINSTQDNSGYTISNLFQFNGFGSSPTDQPSIGVIGNVGTTANHRPYLSMYRSAGNTVDDKTLVPYNYHLGSITWQGADGTDFQPRGAEITAITDSITGVNDMPTALFFGTTANGQEQPTERMRITSNGLVGIRNATPVNILDVGHPTNSPLTDATIGLTSTLSAGTSKLALANGTVVKGDVLTTSNATVIGTGGMAIQTTTNSPIVFRTNSSGVESGGNERMRILEGGNVGIGTASPGSYLLNLRDSIGFSGNGMYFSSTNGGTANPGGYIIGTKRGSWGTRIDFVARDAAGSLTETVMSIDGEGGGGGNVGINTSSPSRPLHVAGTTAIRIPVGTTSDRGTSANGDIRYNTTNANFEWHTGTAWREPVNAARSPAAGLANRFSKFDANGLLDTSAILIQANNRIGIFNSPAAGDSALTVTGGIRATRDMYARRYNVSTFTGQVLSINNYAPDGSLGRNVWIGDGGQASQYTSGQTGGYNVSLGSEALLNNTTGFGNIAIASQTLYSNTTGVGNVAIGGAALAANTIYSYNTAIGANALQSSNSFGNTAIGQSTLNAYNQTTGDSGYNTAIGTAALSSKTIGALDVAIGTFAGRFISNTWGTSVTSSNRNVFIGAECYPNGDGQTGQIVIGYGAVGNGSNTTTIGNSSTTATILQYGETRLGMAVDSGAYTLQVNGNTKLIGNLARKKPVTIAAATYTVLSDDSWLICNHTAQITITLPTAANSIGRELMIKYVAGGGATVISNATNVSPIVGGALTNIILPATAGSWVTLVCDGSNWIIMQKG